MVIQRFMSRLRPRVSKVTFLEFLSLGTRFKNNKIFAAAQVEQGVSATGNQQLTVYEVFHKIP